jgi:hypothetical protein
VAILNAFVQLVKIKDEASKSLEAIAQRAEKVHTAALKASSSLRDMSKAMVKPLGEKAQRDPVSGRFAAQDKSVIEQYGAALKKMGISGGVSAGQLRRLSLQMEIMAEQSLPKAQERLKQAAADVRKLGVDMEQAGFQTKKTMNRFQFMGDVGDDMAKSMRMVSAASQGLMLGMSLLQKNFIGIGFSLIFLQFSGFLKLSLLMAAATVVAGVATQKFKEFFDEIKRVKSLSTALTALTGNTKAYEVVTQRASQIVKSLGIEEKHSKDFTKGLEIAMTELKLRGIEPTADALRIFAQTMAVEMHMRGKDAEEAMASALNTTIQWAKEVQEGGAATTVTFDGITRSISDFDTFGGRSLANFSFKMSATADDYNSDLMRMIGDPNSDLLMRDWQIIHDKLQESNKDSEKAFAESGRGFAHTQGLIDASFSGLPSAAGIAVDTLDVVIERYVTLATTADEAKGSIGEFYATMFAVPGSLNLQGIAVPGRQSTALDAATQEFEDRLLAQANIDRIIEKDKSGDIFRPGEGNALSALADTGWELIGNTIIGGSATPVSQPVKVIINGTIITKDEMADAVQISIQDKIVDNVRLNAFIGFNNPPA